MTITTILIIVAVLVLLYIVSRSARKKSAQSGQEESQTTSNGTSRETSNNDEISGEVLAAIFMALHENQEVVHDVENTVLTLEPVIRNYSPWNSKIYGLRELPRR